MAEVTPQFIFDQPEEPLASKPVTFSTDESGNSTPNSTPDNYAECVHPDSQNTFKQLVASQFEQRSNIGRATVLCPPTPNTSMISDDDEHNSLTPIFGNPAENTLPIPQRGNHPIQPCQLIHFLRTHPNPRPLKIKVKETFLYHYDLPNSSAKTSYNSLSNVSLVAAGLPSSALHTHPEHNERVTGWLLCGKSFHDVLEQMVADTLRQTAPPGESGRNRKLKRNTFIDGLKTKISTFNP